MPVNVSEAEAETETEAGAAVLSALDSDRYAGLRTDLDGLIADPRLGRPATLPPDRRSRLRSRTPIAAHVGGCAGPLAAPLEVAAAAAGPDANQFAGQMKMVQAILGDHRDTAAARLLEQASAWPRTWRGRTPSVTACFKSVMCAMPGFFHISAGAVVIASWRSKGARQERSPLVRDVAMLTGTSRGRPCGARDRRLHAGVRQSRAG